MQVLTSENVWELRKLPARLVVLGGGPIGCELAQAFARFGSKVTQVEMLPRILPREDPEVSEMVSARFRAEGIDVRVGHKAQFAWKTRCAGLRARRARRVASRSTHCCARSGGSPNTSGYGLEELGIPVTKARTVETNEFLQTLYPNIYACGDVAGPYQFTHTASHQAWYAAVNALFGGFRKFRADYSVIPWATFTDPEVARVGLNETEAEERGIAYEVSRYGIDELDRAIADEAAHGMVKVLTVPGKRPDPRRDHRRRARRRPDRRVHHRDAPRHRPEQDPRHDPHLPDAGRGQQIRRRRVEEGARAPGRAEEAGALPRVDARLILPLLLWTSSAAAAFDHAHPSWDALLKKHVVLLDGGKASQLRYADMAREPHRARRPTCRHCPTVSEREFEAWSRAEQMAFLINAYNAFTVEKVLTRYPAIASIWDFGKLFGNPFRDRFFMLFGQRDSLDDLEHGILRKQAPIASRASISR